MFGNSAPVNPLALRKRLLIAESEINRVGIQEEWQSMTAGVRSLAGRVNSVGSLASAAALLVAGVSAFRRGKFVSTDVKPSWFQSALKGAELAGTLWLAFRARSR
jgi:hypothetical protein